VAFLEAARVLRAGAGPEVGGAALTGTLTRFFGTLSSSFSLSPSSEGRFFPRKAFAAGFGAGFMGAALVFRVAGTTAGRTGAEAGKTVGIASFLTGPRLTFLDGAALEISRRSMSFMLRLLLGMRLMRRSKRDRALAICASHMARSFSVRVLPTTVGLQINTGTSDTYIQAPG